MVATDPSQIEWNDLAYHREVLVVNGESGLGARQWQAEKREQQIAHA